MSMKSL